MRGSTEQHLQLHAEQRPCAGQGPFRVVQLEAFARACTSCVRTHQGPSASGCEGARALLASWHPGRPDETQFCCNRPVFPNFVSLAPKRPAAEVYNSWQGLRGAIGSKAEQVGFCRRPWPHGTSISSTSSTSTVGNRKIFYRWYIVVHLKVLRM